MGQNRTWVGRYVQNAQNCRTSFMNVPLASVHFLLLKKCIVFKRIFGQAKMIIKKFIFCLQPSVISLCENTVEWSLSQRVIQ